jgi:hypothetical protein
MGGRSRRLSVGQRAERRLQELPHQRLLYVWQERQSHGAGWSVDSGTNFTAGWMLRRIATSGTTPIPRSAAMDSIHSSKFGVSITVSGPCPAGQDHGPVVPLTMLTTSGQRGISRQSSSSRRASADFTEHTATRLSSNRCTTRTVEDLTWPRTSATSILLCCTAESGFFTSFFRSGGCPQCANGTR